LRTAPTTKSVWHKPVITTLAVKREGVGWLDQSGAIITDIDRVICPPAAQLKLSTSKTKRQHTDKEREAQLNREAVERWRERQHDKQYRNKSNPRVCCTVEYDSFVLDGLVALGQIQENEIGESKIVGAALSEIIAEVLTPEAVAEAMRARDRA
jgi:hypothetical protein